MEPIYLEVGHRHALLGEPLNGRLGKLGPKSGSPWGRPYGKLSCESKCWVRFKFWFDITYDLHRCKE